MRTSLPTSAKAVPNFQVPNAIPARSVDAVEAPRPRETPAAAVAAAGLLAERVAAPGGESAAAGELAFQNTHKKALLTQFLSATPRPEVLCICALSGVAITTSAQLMKMVLIVRLRDGSAVPVYIPELSRNLRKSTPELLLQNGQECDDLKAILTQLAALQIEPRKFTREGLNKELHACILRQDSSTLVESIDRLMLLGADPLHIGRPATPPLCFAAQMGKHAALKAMLAYPHMQSRINTCLPDGNSVVASALSFPHMRVPEPLALLKLLLDAGANPNLLDDDGFSLLHIVAQLGWDAGLELILNHPTMPGDAAVICHPKDPHCSETPPIFGCLQVAMNSPAGSDMSGLKACFDLLASRGTINSSDRSGSTPLILAVDHRGGDETFVKWCIDAGAVLDSITKCASTALSIACFRGHLKIVKMLVELGQPITGDPSWNMTPLAFAAQGGHSAVIRYLLDQAEQAGIVGFIDAPCNSASRTNALLLAIANGHVESVILLARRGANVNHAGDNGTTPLIVAAELRNEPLAEAITQYLLFYNADPLQPMIHGGTPARSAATFGRLGILQKLYDKNNACIDYHESRAGQAHAPLVYAFTARRMEVVKWAMRTMGPTANLGFGNSILHIASAHGVEAVKQTTKLLSYSDLQQLLTTRNDRGQTPLHVAREHADNPAFWWLYESCHSEELKRESCGSTHAEDDKQEYEAAAEQNVSDKQRLTADVHAGYAAAKAIKQQVFAAFERILEPLLQSKTAQSLTKIEAALCQFESLATSHLAAAIDDSAPEISRYVHSTCRYALARLDSAHRFKKIGLGMGHAYDKWHSPTIADDVLTQRFADNAIRGATRFSSHAALQLLRARLEAAAVCKKIEQRKGADAEGRFVCEYEVPGLDGAGIGSDGAWFSHSPYVRVVIDRVGENTRLVSLFPVPRLAWDKSPPLNEIVRFEHTW